MRYVRLMAGFVAVVVGAAACSPVVSPSPTGTSGVAGSTAPAISPATPGPGSACVPGADPAARDWNDRVWYEIFVRSFADGDADGIGDFKGLTAKLDYLNDGDPATTDDLGIGGLWLMPIAQSPSYHGYDVVDYRQVEPDYGTSADFGAFLNAAHERGIKVIVDLVLNHSSNENPWFKDAQTPGSAHDNWYLWETEKPRWLGPSGQVVWHKQGDRWFYGVFWDGMPDLNLRNTEVTAELQDIARFWLQDMGVDGFRIDAAKHLIEDGKVQTNTPETLAWLAGFKQSVNEAAPGAMLVGEVWDPPAIAAAYVRDSLDLTFDFGLATGVRLAIQNGRAAPLKTALTDTLRSWPANQNASFLTNHDQDRIMSQLSGDMASAKLAAFLLLTEPGTPFVYYGEEIGMTGRKPDERIRTPMLWTVDPPAAGFSTVEPWEALSGDLPPVNVASEDADPASLLNAYRDLIRLRSANPALRRGATTIVAGGAEPVIGWLRTTADQTLLAVVNVSEEPVDAYALTLESGPLCGRMAARLLGTIGGDPGATPAAPTLSVKGGLDAYVPFPRLDPRSGYVIALEPAP